MSFFSRLLSTLLSFLEAYPKVLIFIQTALNRFPCVKKRLAGFMGIEGYSEVQQMMPIDLSSLPLRANRIYEELKAGIDTQDKEKS